MSGDGVGGMTTGGVSSDGDPCSPVIPTDVGHLLMMRSGEEKSLSDQPARPTMLHSGLMIVTHGKSIFCLIIHCDKIMFR